MDEECVVAAYETLEKAQKSVHILDRAKYPSSQVSLSTTDLIEQAERTPELKIGDDSLHHALVGAGMGGGIGLLAGIGYLVVFGAEFSSWDHWP